MINKDRVEFCIDAEAYKQILNNILMKTPLRENGVEVAVYMLLYGILDKTNYCVLDVSPFTQEQSWIYLKREAKNESPIADKTPDLVIVGKEFKYSNAELCKDNRSGAYCFVEIKNLAVIEYAKEVEIQKDNTDHYIWTNGLKWVYRYKNKTEVIADFGDYKNKSTIVYTEDYEIKFAELLNKLNSIEWEK